MASNDHSSAPASDAAVDQLVTITVEPPPLDVAQLRDLTGDDAEFISSLAESFATSSKQIVESLRAATASGDFIQISKAAHALKGASANLYAETLRAQAAELEHSGGKLSQAELETRITQMSREIARVSAVLEGMATNGAQSAVG